MKTGMRAMVFVIMMVLSLWVTIEIGSTFRRNDLGKVSSVRGYGGTLASSSTGSHKMEENMRSIALVIFLTMVLVSSVKAQPFTVTASASKMLLERQTKYPEIELTLPLLQVIDVRFKGGSVLGKRLEMYPDWLMNAEIAVKNVSAYNVQSAYLVLRSPKGVAGLRVATWNCPNGGERSCEGAASKFIKPGETIIIESQVTLKSLVGYRDLMNSLHDTAEIGNLEWTFFRTTDRFTWRADGIFSPLPEFVK